MTSVTAIHAKTSASGKKCPESGTNIYPDLFNRAQNLLPSGIVVGPTSRWLRWAVPQVIMQWADIASVERRPTGVRFNLKSANRPALLFQMHRDALLAALRPYPIELRA